MPLFENSMIRKTGQWWKVQIGFLGMIIFLISAFFDESGFKFGDVIETIIRVGYLIGLLSIIFMIAAVKCPECKAKWIWLVAGKRGTTKKWGGPLLFHETCPECENESKIT
jgi:hypothetical protein